MEDHRSTIESHAHEDVTLPRQAILVTLLVVFAVTSGCAFGVGMRFPTKKKPFIPYPYALVSWPLERTASSAVTLGKTTPEELEEQFGDRLPSEVFTSTDPEVSYALYNLKIDWKIAKGTRDGDRIALENQLFVFENDVLVAQAQYSSHESNHTDFDETKHQDIVKGQTTREEVLELLGPANGSRFCPSDAPGNPTGLEYLYVNFFDEFSFGSNYRFKWLTVEFEHGVVSAVRYREGKSTNKPEVDTAVALEPIGPDEGIASAQQPRSANDSVTTP
jgi:hypothetical protein